MLSVNEPKSESQVVVQASGAQSAPEHAITIEAPAPQPVQQTNQSSLALPPRLMSTRQNTHRVPDMEIERDDEANDALYSYVVNGNATMNPNQQFANAGPTRFLEVGDVNECMAVGMTGTRGEAQTPVAAFAHLMSREYLNSSQDRAPNYDRLAAFKQTSNVATSMAATNDGSGVDRSKKEALKDVPVYQTAASGPATYLLDATTGEIHLRGPQDPLTGAHEVGQSVRELDQERREADARRRAALRENKEGGGSSATSRPARPEKPWVEWGGRGPKINFEKCCEGNRCGSCSKCCCCVLL